MGSPKIVTFSSLKGGSSKTTDVISIAEDLADKGHKVLLIDKDHQCNLTHFYGVYEQEGTIAEVYDVDGGDEVKVLNVAPNIDLIAGSMILDEYERRLETDNKKNMMFYLWLRKNAQKINFGQYGYVIIDCHPDFGIATRNAIAVSHEVITPVVPGDFSIEGITSVKVRLANYREDEIDYTTLETRITAKHHFLPCMIANDEPSKLLLERLSKEDNVIQGVIPYKVLFKKISKDDTIIDMMKRMGDWQKHKEFFDTFKKTLEQVEKVIDEA